MNSSLKKFIVLWIGLLIASIGHGLTAFSLGVYAFSYRESSFDSSLVMLLGFLPQVILSIPAGVLADRYDRRNLMIIGDGLSALGLVYILLYKMSGDLTLFTIYIGVVISSIFSSLIEPAFMATISDLLDEKEYTRASGLIQMASSAQYLIAPVLSGILLNNFSLEIILLIDILTIFVTILATTYVRNGLISKEIESNGKFMDNMIGGFNYLKSKEGIFSLVLVSSLLTFFMGFIQTLSSPYILSFSNSIELGKVLSISSLGILFCGFFIGVFALKKHMVNKLSLGLIMAGLFMMIFGSFEDLTIISISGFLFFFMLPIINSSLDYLVRSNLDREYEGRVWALISFISQMGFIASYGVAGLLADNFFVKEFNNGGNLSKIFSNFLTPSASRGIGVEIMLAGLLLALSSLLVISNKKVRLLEQNV